MGEPITLYDADGKPFVVSGEAYAESLLATGDWSLTKPEPKTAAKPASKTTGKKSG